MPDEPAGFSDQLRPWGAEHPLQPLHGARGHTVGVPQREHVLCALGGYHVGRSFHPRLGHRLRWAHVKILLSNIFSSAEKNTFYQNWSFGK